MPRHGRSDGAESEEGDEHAVRYIPSMRFELLISGMLAIHARNAVYMALGAVEGITRAEVELGRAVVEHDGRVTEAALREAVAQAGFEVSAVRALPRELPTL